MRILLGLRPASGHEVVHRHSRVCPIELLQDAAAGQGRLGSQLRPGFFFEQLLEDVGGLLQVAGLVLGPRHAREPFQLHLRRVALVGQMAEELGGPGRIAGVVGCLGELLRGHREQLLGRLLLEKLTVGLLGFVQFAGTGIADGQFGLGPLGIVARAAGGSAASSGWMASP